MIVFFYMYLYIGLEQVINFLRGKLRYHSFPRRNHPWKRIHKPKMFFIFLLETERSDFFLPIPLGS